MKRGKIKTVTEMDINKRWAILHFDTSFYWSVAQTEQERKWRKEVREMKVNILGTEYTVENMSRSECKTLEECDGFCDKTSKRIVIKKKDENCDLDNFEEYRKKVTRHEIIHAFLFESGLHENFRHPEYGHDETTVDWIAVQFPKMLKAFEEADAL